MKHLNAFEGDVKDLDQERSASVTTKSAKKGTLNQLRKRPATSSTQSA